MRQLLPLDLNQWSKTCKDRSFVGADLIELSEQYSSLQGQTAWEHYQGLLHHLRLQLEGGILKGVYEGGEDKTPQLRSAYGILLQIIAIPEQIKSRTLMKEYEARLREEGDSWETNLTDFE